MAPATDYNVNAGVVQFTTGQAPETGDTVSLLCQVPG